MEIEEKHNIFYHLFWDLYRFFKVLFTEGKLKVSKEEAQRRFDICMKCPLMNNEKRFLGYYQPRCGVCGCYLNLKKWLYSEKCPDKKPKW